MITILYKLISTLIYYGLFYGISYLFFCKCDDAIAKNNKKLEVISAALGIFVLCLFAGLRADTVGTDVRLYALSTFRDALNKPLIPFLSRHSDMVIFAAIAYISANLFNSFHVFLFLIQLTIIYPVYKFIRLNSDYISIKYSMLVYLLLFFPMSFNIMRQSMACAVLLVGSYYLQHEKFLKFFFYAALAVLMHNTAAIGIIFFLIAYSTKVITKARVLYVIDGIVILAILFAAKNWLPLVNWLIYTAHVLPAKVSYYVTVFSESTIGKDAYFQIGLYDYVSIALRGLFLIVSLNNLKGLKSRYYYSNLVMVSFVMFCVCLFTFHTSFAYRITMFTDYPLVYTLGVGLHSINGSVTRFYKKDLVRFCLLLAYFFLVYFYFGAHGAVPYSIG